MVKYEEEKVKEAKFRVDLTLSVPRLPSIALREWRRAAHSAGIMGLTPSSGGTTSSSVQVTQCLTQYEYKTDESASRYQKHRGD